MRACSGSSISVGGEPAVVRWWTHREVALCGHAAAETHSVLTRLPRDLRLTPVDAARLLGERFATPLSFSPRTAEHLPRVLAQFAIAGGAVYDALVALAAAEHRAELATLDARAKDTYEKIGVRVVVAA
jgi:toxin FitB